MIKEYSVLDGSAMDGAGNVPPAWTAVKGMQARFTVGPLTAGRTAGMRR